MRVFILSMKYQMLIFWFLIVTVQMLVICSVCSARTHQLRLCVCFFAF
jgi:hypothetical protein